MTSVLARRRVVFAALITVIVFITGTSTSLAMAVSMPRFGDESPGPSRNATPLPRTSGSTLAVEFPISDTYAIAEMRRTSGPAVANRMLHRVRKTMTYNDGVRFSFADSANWGGWIGDTTSAPHLASGAYGHYYAQTVCSTCNTVGPWIGIGGYYSTNIAQAGYDEKRRQGWYELYPNAPVYLGIYPAAGDELFTNVHLDLSTFKWYLAFDDLTTARYWSSEFSFSVAEDTADWITELATGSSVPPSNNVLFTQSQWLDENGYNQSGILTSEDSVININLVNTSCGSIIPSALSNGYQQFTDYVSGC